MPWLNKGEKPLKPFEEKRDNTNNFFIQQARDQRMIETAQKYPLLDIDLWLYLFPDVPPGTRHRRGKVRVCCGAVGELGTHGVY